MARAKHLSVWLQRVIIGGVWPSFPTPTKSSNSGKGAKFHVQFRSWRQRTLGCELRQIVPSTWEILSPVLLNTLQVQGAHDRRQASRQDRDRARSVSKAHADHSNTRPATAIAAYASRELIHLTPSEASGGAKWCATTALVH